MKGTAQQTLFTKVLLFSSRVRKCSRCILDAWIRMFFIEESRVRSKDSYSDRREVETFSSRSFAFPCFKRATAYSSLFFLLPADSPEEVVAPSPAGVFLSQDMEEGEEEEGGGKVEKVESEAQAEASKLATSRAHATASRRIASLR